MKIQSFYILLFLFIGTLVITAQTTVSDLFSKGMVLQQNTKVAIWGKDKPSTKISVEADWGAKASTQTNASGKWTLLLETTKAGGPYSVSISGSSKIQLYDILLGEVWLCSGQSNMEMPLKGNTGQPVFGSQKEILNSTNSQLRFFKLERKISTSPLTEINGKWKSSAPETASTFSAVAYFYGKMLQEQLNVPIGLICSSWGGTPAEAWTPKKTLENGFPEFTEEISHQENYYQRTPTSLFNGMIHPLIPFTIKGAIWYQGEGNKDRSEQYESLFPAMIKSWRDLWQQGEFPFYFVQVAPLQWGGELWPKIREAQLKSMLSVPNSGMAVTLDIGEPTCIHPPQKKPVGERLAYWALAKTYGFKGIEYSGPVYKSMEVKQGKAYLYFDHAPNGVTDLYGGLDDFEIAGADGIYVAAEAKINKGQLVVWNDTIKEPINVRYGWKSYVKGSLFNTAGLPASSFRTEMFKK